jgi:mannitol/fructose-specific phosphotransferase system IIA component (Ntr-type)
MFEGVAQLFGLAMVEVPATARTPEAILRTLLAYLVTCRLVAPDKVEEAVAHLLQREALCSTALGGGVALPHSMTTAVCHPTGVIGQIPHGVKWSEQDSEPVTAVCLLLCPALGEELLLYMRMIQTATREVAAGQAGARVSRDEKVDAP